MNLFIDKQLQCVEAVDEYKGDIYKMNAENKKPVLSQRTQNLLLILLVILGAGTLLYPDISHWSQSRRHHAIMQTYSEGLEQLEAEAIAYELDRAVEHNNALGGIEAVDPFAPGSGSVLSMEYYNILNFDSMMGRIEIPRINVDLPIFHGTSNDVLDQGVGHLEHTPFPIGGYGNHSILSAHTGLATHRMFNDLPLLEEGDIFIITVLTNRIAYEVEDINIVLPHEIELLYSDENHDWITLVTCTPYGINTYRYLVRGRRIPYVENIADEIENITTFLNARMLIIGGFSILFVVTTLLVRGKGEEVDLEMALDREYEAWLMNKERKSQVVLK